METIGSVNKILSLIAHEFVFVIWVINNKFDNAIKWGTK